MSQRKKRRSQAETSASPTPSLTGWRALVANPVARAGAGILTIVVVVFLVYAPALDAPLIFDDHPSVLNNTSIRRLWPPLGTVENPGPLRSPPQAPTSGRPLVNLSFALNYAVGELEPTGYRVVNVTLHILSALLLWAIVRRTLLTGYFAGRLTSVAGPVGFVAALLWSVHPLLIDSIEYVTQRTELLMAICYLATLAASLHYWVATTPRARATWIAIATFFCLAGMASKEVMVSAPLIVLLFERTFITGSFRQAQRSSWPLYVGLALGWGLLLALNLTAPRSESAGFHLTVPAYAWWFTQAKVLLIYLRLAIWPWPLVIHYQIPYLDTLGAAGPWLLPVALLMIATVVLVWRRTALGFALATVFAILAPTLVVPIISEIAAERRMYLPTAALVTLAVAGAYELAQIIVGRRPAAKAHTPGMNSTLAVTLVPALLVFMVYCSLSAQRLAAFADTLTIWQDALAHQPDSNYVRNNVAMALVALGRSPEAIPHFEASVRLKPDDPKPYSHLGFAMIAGGRPQDAIAQFEHVLEMTPHDSSAESNLGFALVLVDRANEAIPHLERAIELDPASPEAQQNMGLALAALERPAEAIPYFQNALDLRPTFVDAATNLGIAELRAGRTQQAIIDLKHALELSSDKFDAFFPLATAYEELGQAASAVATVEGALKLAQAKNKPQLAKQYTAWLQERRPPRARP